MNSSPTAYMATFVRSETVRTAIVSSALGLDHAPRYSSPTVEKTEVDPATFLEAMIPLSIVAASPEVDPTDRRLARETMACAYWFIGHSDSARLLLGASDPITEQGRRIQWFLAADCPGPYVLAP